MVDIAADVQCPHCGWVVVCKHNAGVPYPPGCTTQPPARRDSYSGTFLRALSAKTAVAE
jgi:hypothetical protein